MRHYLFVAVVGIIAAEETMMSELPVYSSPGTYLGVPSFSLPDAEFGYPDLTASERLSVYASHRIVTCYVVPFMFSVDNKRLCVFVPPLDNRRPWMIGGELHPGGSMGAAAANYLSVQAGIVVPIERRQQFLGIDFVDLQRHVAVPGVPGLAVRHELARVIGYAVTEEEMEQFQICGVNADPREFWIDALTRHGEKQRAYLDSALQYVIKKLATRLGEFHGVSLEA